MAKLLIADRDQNERTGIAWLVSSYALNYEIVLTAGTPTEAFRLIEAEVPDVICIELDMIPREAWDSFKELIHHYQPVVIVMTAEATFERAVQGIELHAIDLWVKPQSPDTIKRVLTRCARELLPSVRASAGTAAPASPAVSYRSLFLPQEASGTSYHLMLIQPEDTAQLTTLLSYLQEYPFHAPPVLLPLSDAIVCVFPSEHLQSAQQLHYLGSRLLREWEETSAEPLSIVIYDTDDPLLTLNQKYRHAKQALEIRFFKGYRQISVVQGKVDWLMIDPFLTPAEQRTWIEMLNDGDREKIKRWMYREFLNKEAPYPEPGLLRIRLTSILAQVRRFMKSYYLDEGAVEDLYHRVFETILYNPILYRIVQEFLLFLYEVLDAASHHRESARTDVVEQALRYMEEQFQQSDLRLEDVARYVDRSPAYLSSLMTKRTDSSFRQLLTSIRLKEAQRLLLETNLSVQEIADKSGFVNANYFSRIFKEKTGTSPRSFRNRKK
ncbi:helix-turn-helix domain-containing protein [Brevibacillus humidisoli]|uniref:helix-turn-helix domain-containing protein n=1 Tax=Brevibacillus humidisoli TaxID=2895522 RepID=UPI001E30176D|nr:helix-turn-helix domain-containing protein [Brevibacillus humidisoli]UFJ39504.1 helix-turn-helix domain-containing protein [Brevibacillus humidisoli]